MAPKRVILWTCPRSLSTAFYCSISTLSNTKTLYELFSYPYFFGPPSERFSNVYEPSFVPEQLVIEPTYQAAKDAIFSEYPGAQLVFSKEHALCVPDHLFQEVFHSDVGIMHTFLIRDPERTFYRYYKVYKENDVCGYDEDSIFTEMLSSYQKLWKVYSMVKKSSADTPVIVNAADLLASPDETMRSYCDAVGIVYEPHMTTWNQKDFPDRVPTVDVWTPFRKTIMNSSGFIRTPPEEQKPVPIAELSKKALEFIDICRPIYNEMASNCIKPMPIK